MIRLHTGVPGSGKSLLMVDEIEHSKAYKDRTVYAHGVDGWGRAAQVQCSHPGCRTCRGLAPDQRASMPRLEYWMEWAEAGSLICVDEAHYPFPSRREREQPPHVQRLTEHRHDGIDFFLCTPNANMLDINVRRLVEEHVHFTKKGPLRYKIRHTETMENDERLKLGDRTPFVLPKRSFKHYKSADAHVKLKGRIPRQVVYLVAGVVAFVGCVWWAFGGVSDLRYSTVPVAEAAEPVLERQDLLQSRVASSSAAVSAVNDVPDLGPVAGCMAIRDGRCRCYDDSAHPVSVSQLSCRLVVLGEKSPRALVIGRD